MGGPMFFPGRVDANQKAIVAAIRALPGWRWRPIPNAYSPGTRQLGDGLVRHDGWRPGVWVMVEIKTAKGRVRPEQALTIERGVCIVIRSVDDVLRFLAQHDGRIEK